MVKIYSVNVQKAMGAFMAPEAPCRHPRHVPSIELPFLRTAWGMPETHATMIGCPSCAGCLKSERRSPVLAMDEAKETEVERSQWSAMALLMHLRHIMEMLLDASYFPDAPDPSKIRQRIGQIRSHISAVQRMVDSTTLAARESRTAMQSEGGGRVQL